MEGPDLVADDEEETEENSAEKYRKLLNLVADDEEQKQKDEPDVDMEITWELGAKVCKSFAQLLSTNVHDCNST